MFGGSPKSWAKSDNFFVRHSMSLVLSALLILQTIHALWAGAYVFGREQPLGKGISLWGSEFWMWWTWEYNVSLVADTFGVLLIVLLSKYFYEVGSTEAKDPGEE